MALARCCDKCKTYYTPAKFDSKETYAKGRPITQLTIRTFGLEKDLGYSIAWQHHKGHNPHHWEYWIDNVGTYANDPIKIPYEYVVEMICDWVGAGIVYSKQKCNYDEPYSEPYDYYKGCINERIFHPETQRLIESYLELIEVCGVNEFCSFTRFFVRNRVPNILATDEMSSSVNALVEKKKKH